MFGFIAKLFATLRQSADVARQAKGLKRKTADGRPVFRIACLGHAHSGKTTYWTVLHEATRTQPDAFNLQSGDNPTAAYLIRQREAMQEGAFWIPQPGEKPGPYEPGYPRETDQVVELQFSAREGADKDTAILVQDYPGRAIAVEDADGRSLEVHEFVKGADAALFFVDAVATRTSPQALMEQLLAFNALLKHLEDRKGHILKPVGLLITKADQLDEFRPANPTALLGAEDQRRRGDVYSRFVAQLLRGEEFVRDAAWRSRVEKTLTRLGSFADALLTKCRSTQIFFVSAVGDRRRRPIEPGDAQASLAGSTAAQFVVGRNQSGMAEPVRWLVRELSVMQQVYKARRIRNQALGWAAAWVVLVSLPFLGYLGCAVGRMERDFRATPLPSVRVLKDVHQFESNLFARMWTRISPGHMPTAQRVRLIVARRAVDGARLSLINTLSHNQATGESADMDAAAECARLASFLDSCAKELPDTTADYKDAALQARCLKLVCDQAGKDFALAGAGDRQKAFADLVSLQGAGPCMSNEVRDAAYKLALGIKPAPGAASGAPPAPAASIKDAYNTLVANYGPGTKPEARLNAQLVNNLRALVNSPHLRDPASQAVENQVRNFLAAVAPFAQGTAVKIHVTQLSSPATVQVAQPGDTEFEERDYGEGDLITLKNWKLGTEVRLRFLLKDYSPAPQVLDDFVAQSKQRISVPLQSISGSGTRTVDFQYEIVAPKVSDETVPPLNKVP